MGFPKKCVEEFGIFVHLELYSSCRRVLFSELELDLDFFRFRDLELDLDLELEILDLDLLSELEVEADITLIPNLS